MPGTPDPDVENRDPHGGGAVTIPTLATDRLILRPLELADAEAAQRLFPHWEIVRYMNAAIPWPYPPDGAATFYRTVALPEMAAGKAWHWTLRLKHAPDEMIGLISLKDGPENNRGFWIGLPWQRQGLTTEASQAVTDYWFEGLGRTVLNIPKAIANLASRRISERSGMRVVATEMHAMVSGPQPCEVWEITREEWRRHRAGQTK